MTSASDKQIHTIGPFVARGAEMLWSEALGFGLHHLRPHSLAAVDNRRSRISHAPMRHEPAIAQDSRLFLHEVQRQANLHAREGRPYGRIPTRLHAMIRVERSVSLRVEIGMVDLALQVAIVFSAINVYVPFRVRGNRRRKRECCDS